MKQLFLIPVLIIFGNLLYAQNVGVGTISPAASAILDVSSSTKGFLVPRMTTLQRNAIAAPANGLMVYDTDLQAFQYFNGTVWNNIGGASSITGGWGLNGNAATNAQNFVGTTDDKPLQLRVNNRRSGWMDKYRNVFMGDSSGTGLPTVPIETGFSAGNIAIGAAALKNNKDGYGLVAIGDSALYANLGHFWGLGFDGINNTAVGEKSQRSTTVGSGNTSMGSLTLQENTLGNFNTAIGTFNLRSNTTGAFNTAVGAEVGILNTTGNNNTGVGLSSLRFNTTGSNNVGVGVWTLLENKTGRSNVAVGYSALKTNQHISNLVAIGDSALFTNGLNATLSHHGAYNSAVGSKALFSNTNGYHNSALGYQVLFDNTTGYGSTGVGAFVLSNNTTGSDNSGLGRNSLFNNSTGYANVAVGSMALNGNATGNENVAMGVSSLSINSTGSGNTAIGNNADVSLSNFNNSMALGNGSTVTASNKIRLGNAAVTVIEGNSAYTTSDGRFKQHVKDNVPGLDLINSLKPLTYQYKSFEMEKFVNQKNPERLAQLQQADYAEAEAMVHMGFIAQDVDKLLKEKGYNISLVHTPQNATDNYSIAYGELIPSLVKAMQEQQKMIEELRKEISHLKSAGGGR